MSRNIQNPIILKKADSARPQRQKAEPTQPKILTKASSRENPTNSTSAQPQQQQQVRKEQDAQPEVLSMKNVMRFMSPHFNIDQKIFDYIDADNSDFLVVATIGVKNVGKSTLANIIANQEYVKFHPDGSYDAFQRKNEVFMTKKAQNYEGSTIGEF